MINILKLVKSLYGAVSIVELVGLHMTITKELKAENGVAVDFGSHAGKSAFTAIHAMNTMPRYDPFFMIDPLYDLNNAKVWETTTQGTSEKLPWGYANKENHDRFMAEIDRNMDLFPTRQITTWGTSSLHFLEVNKESKFSYVFIDSDDHQEELVDQEVKILEDKMLPGGLIFFHDFLNQYKGPAQAHAYLLRTGKYELIKIPWIDVIQYVKDNDLKKDDNCWHACQVEYPIFLGCVRRK